MIDEGIVLIFIALLLIFWRIVCASSGAYQIITSERDIETMNEPKILKSIETKKESGCIPGTEYRFKTYEKKDAVITRITLVVNKM